MTSKQNMRVVLNSVGCLRLSSINMRSVKLLVWNTAEKSQSISEQLRALELENRRLQDELICLHETNTDILQLESASRDSDVG